MCEICRRDTMPAFWWHDVKRWLCYPCYGQIADHLEQSE